MLASLVALMLMAPVEPLFASDNLMAWCIVPFDAKNRTPEARAEMLARLGFKKFAYDWRAEHVASFERELEALKKHNVQLSALWFPGGLTKENRHFLAVLDKHKVKTQLWVMLVDFPAKDQAGKVQQATEFVRPIAEEAAKYGHEVALYNHGGWGGEPENQLAVIAALKLKNVGIVYNLHHGHDHLPRFAELLKKMLPHLLVLNLNGMNVAGDKKGQKILPLGHGTEDRALLQIIQKSGYRGPIGILGHTSDDAEQRLQDNLDGLQWLLKQTTDKPLSAKRVPRTPTGMPYQLKSTPNADGFVFQAVSPEVQKMLKSLKEEQLAEVLKIYRVDGRFDQNKLADQQALFGDLTRAGNQLTFAMKFPPQDGQTYRAYLDLAQLTGDSRMSPVFAEVSLAAVKREPTAKVVQVYPTSAELPENILRLYFEFSAPMNRGSVYENIKLLDEKNELVKYPFLELDQELWSPDGTRFTLLFDPGRIKKGLVPREELGPPLEAGKSYTLEIAQTWKDENGTPMKETFRKRFKATKALERGLDLRKDFHPGPGPIVDSDGAYTIKFGLRSLDSALLQRMIWVEDAEGQRVEGTNIVGPNERSWQFKPAKPWREGEYQLKIDTRLEDICGNRVGEAFEVDTFKPTERKPKVETVGWSFSTRK
jgi:sugar phosphate isomerase/epimerase